MHVVWRMVDTINVREQNVRYHALGISFGKLYIYYYVEKTYSFYTPMHEHYLLACIASTLSIYTLSYIGHLEAEALQCVTFMCHIISQLNSQLNLLLPT